MRALNVLLALAVSLLIAFGVAEGGLRLLGYGPPQLNTQFDAELGWSKTPDSTVHRSTGEYEVTIETDALGLRDDYAAAETKKPDGTFRAVFLGDSFVLGYTVDRADLFVDQIERAWGSEGRKIEIVNAGTQAYSTDQALRWLQLDGEAFDPDLVVLFPYENDIWWNAQERYLDQDKPVFDESGELVTRELTEAAARGWFRRTAVGETIHRFFGGKTSMETIVVASRDSDAQLELPVEKTPRMARPTPEAQAAEARTRVLVGRLGDEATRLGARFAVCPIPSKYQMEEAKGPTAELLDNDRPYELFVDAGRAAGAVVIEPLEALKAARADDDPYYERDFHLDPSGNVVLASVVKDALDDASLVPARADGVAAVAPAGPSSPTGGTPTWPFWYVGLVAVLGTLYARTYTDEPVQAAYGKVASLLAVVFSVALGVTWLVGVLPPQAGQIVLLGLIIALLTFVLYKLGDRVGTIAELLKAFTLRGHWYLMPLLSVLLTIGSLLVVAASSPLVAPFIYTLF